VSEPTLLISIDCGPDADAAYLESRTSALRNELLRLQGVEAVERARVGPAPERAKAIDLAAFGTLVVKLGPGAARGVIRAVQSWRGGRISIKAGDLEVVVEHPTAEQQQQLLEAVVARLEGGTA
jgi:hypothetical protein